MLREQSSQNLPKLPPGYRYVREISRGTQGTVALVLNENIGSKGRYEAIKILNAEQTNANAYQRFCQEIDILAQLNHPNIVHLYYSNFEERYFIMELVEGGHLKAFMKQGEFALAKGLEILQQVIQGVEFAHNHNLIHRDIKPQNILLTKTLTPKITDFGIAKAVAEGGITAPKTALGSPRYMSPEQFEDAKNVDHRTDIWSLGAILYEMVTGFPLFADLTGFNLIYAIVQKPIPLLRDSMDNFPEELASLEDICKRALQKKAQDRYSSAKEMLQTLELAMPAEKRQPHTGVSAQPRKKLLRTQQLPIQRRARQQNPSAEDTQRRRGFAETRALACKVEQPTSVDKQDSRTITKKIPETRPLPLAIKEQAQEETLVDDSPKPMPKARQEKQLQIPAAADSSMEDEQQPLSPVSDIEKVESKPKWYLLTVVILLAVIAWLSWKNLSPTMAKDQQAFLKAQAYHRQNPDQYRQIVLGYRKIADQFPASPYAGKSLAIADRLQRRYRQQGSELYKQIQKLKDPQQIHTYYQTFDNLLSVAIGTQYQKERRAFYEQLQAQLFFKLKTAGKLYDKPKVGANIVKVVKKGSYLAIAERKDEWLLLYDSTTMGWLRLATKVPSLFSAEKITRTAKIYGGREKYQGVLLIVGDHRLEVFENATPANAIVAMFKAQYPALWSKELGALRTFSITDRQVTRKNFIKLFKVIKRENSQRNLLMFYSGYILGSKKSLYFTNYDIRISSPQKTGVPVSWFFNQFSKIPGKKILLLDIDFHIENNEKLPQYRKKWRRALSHLKQQNAIIAGDLDNYPGNNPDNELFFLFMKALDGRADFDNDHILIYDELAGYILPKLASGNVFFAKPSSYLQIHNQIFQKHRTPKQLPVTNSSQQASASQKRKWEFPQPQLQYEDTPQPNYQELPKVLFAVVYYAALALGIGLFLCCLQFGLLFLGSGKMKGRLLIFYSKLFADKKILWKKRWAEVEIAKGNFGEFDLDNSLMQNSVWVDTNFMSTKCASINLENSRCSRTIFDYARFNKAKLAKATFSGASFQMATIDNSDFTNATLTNSKFNDAMLKNLSFQHANLNNVNFGRTTLENVNFSGANLQNVDFTKATLRNVNFANAVLGNTRLQNTRLYQVNFCSQGTKCNLAYAHISNCYFQREMLNAEFLEATIDSSEFQEASLRHCNLLNSTFTNTTFTEVHLEKCNFKGLSLQNCYFDNCKFLFPLNFELIREATSRFYEENIATITAENKQILIDKGAFVLHKTELQKGYRTNFRYEDLSNLNLQGAKLRKADLTNADLTNSKLLHADLTDSVLREAVLIQSDFQGANLEGVDLSKSYIADSNIIEQPTLKQVHTLEHSTIIVSEPLADSLWQLLTERGAKIFQYRQLITGRYAHLAHIRLIGLELQKAPLDNCDFSHSILRNIDFRQCKLKNSQFVGSKLQNVKFIDSSLQNANFSEAFFDNVQFRVPDFQSIASFRKSQWSATTQQQLSPQYWQFAIAKGAIAEPLDF